MSAVTDRSVDECCCLVVSIGFEANVTLGTVPRDDHRWWYAVAIGPDAATAGADRMIETGDDGEAPLESILADLSNAWAAIEFVYVVFDQRDDDARALACAILEDARAPARTVVAVLLGRTFACHSEPLRRSCDCLLRLADDRAPAQMGEPLTAVLSPFASLWAPIDLDTLAQHLRAASDAQVLAHRSTSAVASALTSLLAPIGRAPHFIHLLHGEGAVRMREVSEFWSPEDLTKTEFSGGITDELASDELLVAVVAPLGARGEARRAPYLRTILADRANELLPRDGRVALYRQRLRDELDWWTARDERTEPLLELAATTDGLRRGGGVVGPALRNAGGSLAAYLLGLCVFDPVEWELWFEEFVKGRDTVVLEAVVSPRTLAEHELPSLQVRADGSLPPVAFVADPRLEDVGGIDDWRRVLDARRATLDRDAAGPSGHALGFEPDITIVPGIVAITECSGGRLLYDHQITAALSQLMMVSYPDADRLRRRLAKGGASADEAIARLVRVRVRGDTERPIGPIGEQVRQRALTSTPRSIALSDALTEVARATCDMRKVRR